MPRPEYPSDEKRRKSKPAVRVHVTIVNHPKYGRAFADPTIRGVILGIWLIALRAHISKTGDELTLSPADVGWITGKERGVDAAKLLRRGCEALAYCLRVVCDKHANCPRHVCKRSAMWVISVRNFSRKQGFTPQRAEYSLRTPHPSESESESESESVVKKNKTPSESFPELAKSGHSGNQNQQDEILDPEVKTILQETQHFGCLATGACAAFWRAAEKAYFSETSPISLEAELERADAWLLANPRRKPTDRGMKAFVRNWLETAVERQRKQVPTIGQAQKRW